ncbi:MAG: BspA family leucine-rich repeat surface protein, partial [Mollicutes bacterium]|nr:BspA family leucine-rich repeat surface protein [Mollicutes bacterium]
YSQSPTTGYIILNDEYLFAGTSKTYNLYVWVDYGEDGVNNSQMNKTFEGIVAITDSVVYNRQGLYTLLNQQQANISTLPKLLTNNHNSIIDLTKNQGVDVNNVTNIYSVDLHKARPDYQNLNMAFFADVDNSDVIVTWTEGNNFFIGERNQIKLSSNMSYAFSNSYVASIEQTQLKSVILRNFNTSKVTNMAYMFAQIGVEEGFNLDLGKNFNTSNVTNMSHIFFWTGDKNFSRLNLGNKFNTANVTDMSDMFRRVGMDSNEFTLELGSHFNTWKVTNMSNMFEHAGYNSTVFTLNLGNHFNTSNVTNMSSMFGGTGRNSLVFTLDLGLKFNTLKVTNMSTMFMGAGYSSPIFKLNLGSQFNTINSSDMFMMFSSTGYSSIDFTLNLNDFVINNTSVDLLYFAEEIGATNIVFGSGWATTGANITNETFYRLKPVNVYYTDTSFHSFRVGNKTMWNRWRGSGNTTFIAGSP